jgi:hypothetical protein
MARCIAWPYDSSGIETCDDQNIGLPVAIEIADRLGNLRGGAVPLHLDRCKKDAHPGAAPAQNL